MQVTPQSAHADDVESSAASYAVPAEARSERLLHRLITDHAKALLAYAERLLSDRHAAEDIVQETLIRAWEHTDRLYGNAGSVRGWLLTVTRNLVIDQARSASVRHELVSADHHEVIQPDHSDTVLAAVQVKALLRQLSHEHREALVHTYICGKTIQEAAEILGVPEGTVKSRQYYALRHLRTRVVPTRR
ncbi:sigma-70 family RNA polymerase sigma factor [Streptomyces sp. NPDC001914]|uniref:sigma-70 family RNA polymerase sigma factor n=1 Tax=Streptomyces sp. NPDC001914 TaxID=3364623 RepID=UPI00367489C4